LSLLALPFHRIGSLFSWVSSRKFQSFLHKIPPSPSFAESMKPRSFLLLFVLGVLTACQEPPPRSVAPATVPAAPASPESLSTRLEKALTEKRPSSKLEKLSKLAQELALEEIPDALRLAKDLPEFRERGVLQSALLRRWADLDTEAAFDYVATMPEGRNRTEAIALAAAKLAERDPSATAHKVARLKGRASRSAAIETVAEVWAKKDARAALRWARTLSNGFERETALTRVRFVWVHDDPEGSYQEVKDLPPGDMKNSLITNIAAAWALRDPVAAQRWAFLLPQGPEQELGLINVAESWADYRPEAAAAFAQQLPPGEIRRRAIVSVTGRWVTQNPVAAGQWAEKIGDLETQRMAMAELMNFWGILDPEQAGAWIHSLAPGPAAQAAISGYIDAVVYWAPDLAAQHALALDPPFRDEKLVPSVGRWLELDPAAAKQWLKKTNVPKETKERCLAAASSPSQ
jgi:hypothetical protein